MDRRWNDPDKRGDIRKGPETIIIIQSQKTKPVAPLTYNFELLSQPTSKLIHQVGFGTTV
jgi:hypothetical protein